VGAALTFVTQFDILLLRAIEQLTKAPMKPHKVSDKQVAQFVTEVLVAKREAEIKLDESNFGEKREINRRKQMILDGIPEEDVEKVLLERKLKRKERGQKRISKLTDQVERERQKV